MIRILEGDCRVVLATLPDASVHCVVTSPPYFGLRDYGTAQWDGGDALCDHRRHVPQGEASSSTLRAEGKPHHHLAAADVSGLPFRNTCARCGAIRVDRQIGLEKSPSDYLETMVAVFREVRRVLRDDGTCWVNIGDSYASNGTSGLNGGFRQRDTYGHGGGVTAMDADRDKAAKRVPSGLKSKDLLLMPARLALALQADGWWVRSDIIWHKPNPMPESVTDRPTSAYEHVFLLTRSARYFYDADAVREAQTEGSLERWGDRVGERINPGTRVPTRGDYESERQGEQSFGCSPAGRNLRNVWTIATHAYPDAHFATFPPELAERCIRAGTSQAGCCSKCLAPWVRVVERETRPNAPSLTGKYNGNGVHRTISGGVSNDGRERTDNGWSQSCTCPPSDPVPCTVLDPFAGAFTSPMVADRLQRHAIGIELSEAYCTMARARMERDAGMFLGLAEPSAPVPEPPEDARIADLFAEMEP